jgi:GNAT superfamily N-acetyltransferase
MEITLRKASLSDANELYDLQIKSFKQLLDKYHDYDFSPGAEKIEKTMHRLKESNSDYYFICLNNINIGAVRVIYANNICSLKQIYILPEYQGNGFAQQAICNVEKLYPDSIRWELDTIKQEEKLCYLYEKMGYVRTGKEENIKLDMDLIFFAK